MSFWAKVGIGLAVKLSGNLIKFLGDKLSPEEEKALRSACEKAIQKALEPFDLEKNERDHYAERAEAFLGHEDTARELVKLVEPGSSTLLDLTKLHQTARETGFDPEHLGKVDFIQFLSAFIEGFLTAAAHEPPLRDLIKLRNQGANINAVLELTQVNKGSAADIKEIKQLLGAFLSEKRTDPEPNATPSEKSKTKPNREIKKTPIHGIVRKKIETLLSSEPGRPLLLAMKTLNLKKGDRGTPRALASRLVPEQGNKLIEAVETLDLAVNHCLRNPARKDEQTYAIKKEVWTIAVSVLGWLVILGVDDKWAEKNAAMLAEEVPANGLHIPLRRKVGIATAVARLRERPGRFSGDNPLDVWDESAIYVGNLPEAGFHGPDRLFDIKKIIYKHLWGEEPDPLLSMDEVDQRLKQTLERRAKKSEYFYLVGPLPGDPDWESHILKEAGICNQLAETLKRLPILLTIEDQAEQVLVVPEIELETAIAEFFRNQESLGV